MKTSSKISIHESGFQEPVPLKEREWVSGYIRVSSRGQEERGFGLEVQKRAIQNYCKQKFLALHHVYSDTITGVESSLNERKEYWKMIDYARKAGIRKIIVVDLSRLFRDVAAAVQVKKSFIEIGLEVISLNQPTYSIYSDKDPSDFLINQIMEALAHFDRLNIIQKLKAGRSEKARQGRYSGGGSALSTGVRVINRELAVNEEEIKTVKLIFRLRKRGFSPYAISKFLNERGIKGRKGGSWFPTGIKRVLKNRIYKGYLKSGPAYFPSKLGKLI